MRTSLNFKHSLLLGTSIASLALLATPASAQSNSGNETVIVTGTRVQGMTAADSAAPVTVLGSDALTRGSGSQDLRQSLGQTVPSFTSQSFSGDLGHLTRAANLRGLSPNDTLVLINGKRRHQTAGFQTGGGGFGGNSAPDLSMIPTAAIDHVEVLLDGAAAQYGTDAISGVVNIILKKRSSGGSAMVTGGRRYNTQGDQYDYSVNIGLPLFDKGYANLTLEKQYSNFVQLGGADSRLFRARWDRGFGRAHRRRRDGGQQYLCCQIAQRASCLAPAASAFPWPRARPWRIIPVPTTKTAARKSTRSGFPTTRAMTSATIFRSKASAPGVIATVSAWRMYRMPNQNIAAPGSNQPCSATNPQGYKTGSSTNNI